MFMSEAVMNLSNKKMNSGKQCENDNDESFCSSKFDSDLPRTEKLCIISPQIKTSKKHKIPKFVPYEPYKCAISSITISENDKLKMPQSIEKYNCLLIQSDSLENEASDCWAYEKNILLFKITSLEERVSYLESHLNAQLEITSDLKKLLLAAVSEDLQLKIETLTIEKEEMLGKLFEYNNECSVNSEKVESLKAENKVWRSKYNGCRLLLKELISWKDNVTSKIKQLMHSVNDLVSQEKEMEIHLASCFSYLRKLHKLEVCKNALLERNQKYSGADKTIRLSLVDISAWICDLSIDLYSSFTKYLLLPIEEYNIIIEEDALRKQLKKFLNMDYSFDSFSCFSCIKHFQISETN